MAAVNKSGGTAGSAGLSREKVIDTAARIAETEGIAGLTMRKLAAELGVAPPAIYWHVGNKEALLDQLVERVITDVGELDVDGTDAAARIVSAAHSLRAKLLRYPNLIGLAEQRGRIVVMLAPSQRTLARELAAAGLPPRQVGTAVWTLLWLVISAVVLERTIGRTREPSPRVDEVWGNGASELPPALARELRHQPSLDSWFRSVIDAQVRALLG